MLTTPTHRRAFTAYGPGDPETWGPVMSHRDPRYVDPCEDCDGCPECCPDWAADAAEEDAP